MSGVPIFPSGIVKQYISPIPFGNNTDLTKFTFDQQKGSTKLRTEKHKNILLDPSLKDLKTWIEIQAKDYLDNELRVSYDEFFFTVDNEVAARIVSAFAHVIARMRV